MKIKSSQQWLDLILKKQLQCVVNQIFVLNQLFQKLKIQDFLSNSLLLFQCELCFFDLLWRQCHRAIKRPV